MKQRRIVRMAFLAAMPSLLSAATAVSEERMVGVVPSDGINMLAKRISVPAGTTVIGVEFRNNDARTVFPEVVLVSGVDNTIAEGVVMARATDVRESEAGWARILWASPVTVREPGDYIVAVRIPAGPGKQRVGEGAGLGAVDAAEATGSFLAGGPEGELMPVSVDLTINLLTAELGKAVPGLTPGESTTPRTFLSSGTPNPASVVATIRFGVERRSEVQLGVYDVAGRRVRMLAEESMDAGVYSLTWDGRDDASRRVAAGVYIAKLETGGKRLTQKLVLTK